MNNTVSKIMMEEYNIKAKKVYSGVFVFINLLRFTPVFLLATGWNILSDEKLNSWIEFLMALTVFMSVINLLTKVFLKKKTEEQKNEEMIEKVKKLIKNNMEIITHEWMSLFFLSNIAWAFVIYKFGWTEFAILVLITYMLSYYNRIKEIKKMHQEFFKQYSESKVLEK